MKKFGLLLAILSALVCFGSAPVKAEEYVVVRHSYHRHHEGYYHRHYGYYHRHHEYERYRHHDYDGYRRHYGDGDRY